MRNIGPIITTSIRNNLRLKAAAITSISVILICAIGIALIFCLLFIAPAMEAKSPDRSEMALYLSLIMYTTCLLGVGVNLNAFAFQSMTKEKSRGIIESLLATPLKVPDIWIAKSLAVFLPGLVVAEVFTFIALIAVNYIYFVPRIGFLINPWIAISSFVAAPLIYLCLSLLVHLIGLAGKPTTGNVIIQIILPVIITLMINLIARNILDAATWTFSLANLAIAAIVGVIVILLRPRLTRERIVLSLRS